MNKTYGYVYLTENLVNGMCYIGQHVNNDVEYLGSGKYLLRAIDKYGKENFIKTIIEWCKDAQELNEREIYWIAKCDAVNSPYFYNITEGGYGCSGYKHTKEHKNYISNKYSGEGNPMAGKPMTETAKIKTKETKKKRGTLGAWNKGSQGLAWYNNGIKEIYAVDCPDGYSKGRLKRKRDSHGRFTAVI